MFEKLSKKDEEFLDGIRVKGIDPTPSSPSDSSSVFWAKAGYQDPYENPSERRHKTKTSKRNKDRTPTTKQCLPEANIMAHSKTERELADLYQREMSTEYNKNEYSTYASNNGKGSTGNDEALARASQTLERQKTSLILNDPDASNHPLIDNAKAFAKTAFQFGYQLKTNDHADAEESDSTSSNESSVSTVARNSKKYKSDNGFVRTGYGSDDCTHYKGKKEFFDEEDNDSEDEDEEGKDSDEEEEEEDEDEEEEGESKEEGKEEEEDEAEGEGEEEGEEHEEGEEEGDLEEEGEEHEEGEEEEDEQDVLDTSNKKDSRGKGENCGKKSATIKRKYNTKDTKLSDDSSISSSFDVSIDDSNNYKPCATKTRRMRVSDPPMKQLTLEECVPRYVISDSNAPSANEYRNEE